MPAVDANAFDEPVTVFADEGRNVYRSERVGGFDP